MLAFPTLAAAALALLPAFSLGQTTNTTGLPTCALTCTLSSLPGTACEAQGVSNVTCICTDSQFQLKFYQCQSSTCSPTDLQAALAFGAQTCEQNGTPINTAVTPSGFSATSSGASSTPSAESSAISSVSSAVSSAASAVSSAAAGGSSTRAPSASGSAPSAAASQPASGAVGYRSFNSIVAVGASLVGVAAGLAVLF